MQHRGAASVSPFASWGEPGHPAHTLWEGSSHRVGKDSEVRFWQRSTEKRAGHPTSLSPAVPLPWATSLRLKHRDCRHRHTQQQRAAASMPCSLAVESTTLLGAVMHSWSLSCSGGRGKKIKIAGPNLTKTLRSVSIKKKKKK